MKKPLAQNLVCHAILVKIFTVNVDDDILFKKVLLQKDEGPKYSDDDARHMINFY